MSAFAKSIEPFTALLVAWAASAAAPAAMVPSIVFPAGVSCRPAALVFFAKVCANAIPGPGTGTAPSKEDAAVVAKFVGFPVVAAALAISLDAVVAAWLAAPPIDAAMLVTSFDAVVTTGIAPPIVVAVLAPSLNAIVVETIGARSITELGGQYHDGGVTTWFTALPAAAAAAAAAVLVTSLDAVVAV